MNLRRTSLAMIFLLASSFNARAQEPVWSFRIGAGGLVSVGNAGDLDPHTRVTLGRVSPVISVDAIRALDCCLEVWISGAVPWIKVDITSAGIPVPDAGRVSFSALQVGMNYRVWHRDDLQVYAGPFLGAFPSDRSSAVQSTTGTTVYRFPGAWGAGATFGFRTPIKKSERFKFDANLRWQQAHLPTGESDRILWDPVIITGGLLVRLW